MPESKYKVTVLPRFEKNLKKLDLQIQRRISTKLAELQHSPEAGKALHGNLRGRYSLRVDDLRVIYLLAKEKREIFVLSVAHRKKVYE